MLNKFVYSFDIRYRLQKIHILIQIDIIFTYRIKKIIFMFQQFLFLL